MKSVVLLFVIPAIGLCLSASSAEAQRSGSLQATARVVDTRQSAIGLQSAHTVAALVVRGLKATDLVEGSVAQVTVVRPAHEEADRPRTALITINYLRN